MLVHTARKLEINKIRQSMMLRCVNLALFFVSSKVMAFVCILLFLLDGGELNAEIVFVSMSMFSQIRENMTYHFPFGTAIGIEVCGKMFCSKVKVILKICFRRTSQLNELKSFFLKMKSQMTVLNRHFSLLPVFQKKMIKKKKLKFH